MRFASLLAFLLCAYLPGQDCAPNRVLMRCKAGADAAALAATVGGTVDELAPIGVHVVSLPEGVLPADAAGALIDTGAVDYATPDNAYPPAIDPNDTFYPGQWHLAAIDCPAAWEIATGSESIAILDTGCNPHSDLALVPGWNFWDGNANTTDVVGHGTRVAGCAAARTNNGIGVASPGWGCKVMPLRVTDTAGLGYVSLMAKALVFAGEHGVRVANISYMVSPDPTILAATQWFMEKANGVTTIAVGNFNWWFETAPDNPYALTVSATANAQHFLAPFTTTGNQTDIAAPGMNIWTTTSLTVYVQTSGTSCSCALVAGCAGILVTMRPDLTGAQIQTAIQQSAVDQGPPGWDPGYGHGVLSVLGAITVAAGM